MPGKGSLIAGIIFLLVTGSILAGTYYVDSQTRASQIWPTAEGGKPQTTDVIARLITAIRETRIVRYANAGQHPKCHGASITSEESRNFLESLSPVSFRNFPNLCTNHPTDHPNNTSPT